MERTRGGGKPSCPFLPSSPMEVPRDPWPDTAIDASKCDKDEEQHRIGVSSETKELGSTWPQPVVEDNGEWFKYHPHDAPQPQIGPPHLRVPKTMPRHPSWTNPEPPAPSKRPRRPRIVTGTKILK